MGRDGERVPRPPHPHPRAEIGREPASRGERAHVRRGERRQREVCVDRARAVERRLGREPALSARQVEAAQAHGAVRAGGHAPRRLDRREREPARDEAELRHLELGAAGLDVPARGERERGRGEAPSGLGVEEGDRHAAVDDLETVDLDREAAARLEGERARAPFAHRPHARRRQRDALEAQDAAQQRERRVHDLEARHVHHRPAAGGEAEVLEHERMAERAADLAEPHARVGRPLEEVNHGAALERAHRAGPAADGERERHQHHRYQQAREPAPEPPHA